MFRKLHRQIHQIVQRLRNMANNSNKNQDAEVSQVFVDQDRADGKDAFEAASLAIPQTARPEITSPLAKTFAEEGKGTSNTRFTPTPRPEPKADNSDAQPQVPRDAWICCLCDVTNPLVGPACWNCKTHYACARCYSA